MMLMSRVRPCSNKRPEGKKIYNILEVSQSPFGLAQKDNVKAVDCMGGSNCPNQMKGCPFIHPLAPSR